MKKIWIFIILTMPNSLLANYTNPMFENHKINSISIQIAQSTGHGDLGHLIMPWEWDFSPMTMVAIQYSQPTRFLRLPSRVNIQLLQNFAYRSNDGASFGALGISWDIAFFNWRGWYIGAGLGPYMRDSADEYVESRLVFGEKVFVGKHIAENLNAELFTLHFSNGDFTEINHGFNFIGLSLNYSF